MINLILFMVYLLKLPCILRHDSRTPIWVFLKYLRKVMRSPAGFPIYTLAQPRALLGTSHVQIIRSIQHPIDIQPSIGYYLLSRGLNLSKLSSLHPSTFPLCTQPYKFKELLFLCQQKMQAQIFRFLGRPSNLRFVHSLGCGMDILEFIWAGLYWPAFWALWVPQPLFNFSRPAPPFSSVLWDQFADFFSR